MLEKAGMFGVRALWKALVTNNNLSAKRRHKRGGGKHMRKVLPHPAEEAFSSIGDVLLEKFASELTGQISGVGFTFETAG